MRFVLTTEVTCPTCSAQPGLPCLFPYSDLPGVVDPVPVFDRVHPLRQAPA